MQWRASHILVEDHLLASEIYAKLQRGEEFAVLARRYSTCRSKKRGGDLGWFGAGKMIRPFENSVRKLKVGKMSKPIRTQFGTHIILKTGQR